MEIILKQDIPNLGSKDDIIKVKDGYARNYLIPQKIAVMATDSAKKMLEENNKQRAHKEAKLIEEANSIAEKLKDIKLTIGAKSSSTGKIFGSVTNIQIAEALSAKGFNIERKNIYLKGDTVKDLGTYNVTIKLHKEVKIEIEFEVVAE